MPATIKGSAKLVVKSLQDLPLSVDRAIATGLARGLLYAVSLSQRNYLSGPRPQKLDVRTRRLRDSVSSEVEIDKTVIALERGRGAQINPVTVGSGNITGRIGTNVEYAAFHEFGFHGIINVQAHQRVFSTFDVAGQRIDQRRKLFDHKGNFIGYKESHARALGYANNRAAFVFHQQVRAHQRNVDYRGRPYLRPALEDALPAITREINRELKAL